MSRSSRVLGLLALSLFLLGTGAPSVYAKTPPHYMRLWYYTGSSAARKAFLAHPTAIDIFAPQSYDISDTGVLEGGVDADLLAFASKNHIKVMPLITNDGFTQLSYQGVLGDSKKQGAVIAALIAEAKKKGYWGWQIDFEQMDASYKDQFSTFVANAYQALHTNGLTLSVAVISKVSDNPTDYPNNLWQKLIGVYDYAAIGASSDFVTIMSYDDPTSKGPVAQYPWLVNVLLYSMGKIPAPKVSLGIPFYYWQWEDLTGKRVGIGGNSGLQTALSKYAPSYHYDYVQEAPYVHYWNHGKSYTLWYENGTSVAKKIQLIKNNHLYGFSGWTLGLEVPSVYNAVKE